MKLWTLATFCAASLLILSGCAVKPTPKKEPVIDETLPLVKLTKNGTIVDFNAIALEWSAIDDKRVKGIYIYKVALDENNSNKDEYYDTVDNRFSTHYLDKKIKPNSKYNYYFKTYSDNAESRESEITLITSLAPMDSVTWIHAIQDMPRRAKIIWRPHTNQSVKAYIIERRTLEEENWKRVATTDGRLSAEFVDSELKDKYTYKYRIRALTYDDIISKPSEEVTAVTKALPKEVTYIAATIDLPRKIEIKWEQTDSEDFLNYNLYRASSIAGNYELISSLKNSSYVDKIEEDGKQYFYRVSVVDKDSLESMHDKHSALGTTLVKPRAPSLVEAKLIGEKVKISWSSSDDRIKSYSVQKRYKKSLFDESIEDFENIKGTEFIDSEIESEKSYYYKTFGVDINGIKSEPSIEVELKIGKISNNNIQKSDNSNNRVERRQQLPEEQKPNSGQDVITPIQDFN